MLGSDFQDPTSLRTQVETRRLGAKEWPPGDQTVPLGRFETEGQQISAGSPLLHSGAAPHGDGLLAPRLGWLGWLGWLARAEPRLHEVAWWKQHCQEAGGRPATWPQRPLVAFGIPARSHNIVTSLSGSLKVTPELARIPR